MLHGVVSLCCRKLHFCAAHACRVQLCGGELWSSSFGRESSHLASGTSAPRQCCLGLCTCHVYRPWGVASRRGESSHIFRQRVRSLPPSRGLWPPVSHGEKPSWSTLFVCEPPVLACAINLFGHSQLEHLHRAGGGVRKEPTIRLPI